MQWLEKKGKQKNMPQDSKIKGGKNHKWNRDNQQVQITTH